MSRSSVKVPIFFGKVLFCLFFPDFSQKSLDILKKGSDKRKSKKRSLKNCTEAKRHVAKMLDSGDSLKDVNRTY